MKKTIIMFVLLCFVGKASFGHVSKKEVKAAKDRYISDSIGVVWYEAHYDTMPPFILPDFDSSDIIKEWRDNRDTFIDMRKNIVECERLTYEGYKAIRHDQKFWIKKR